MDVLARFALVIMSVGISAALVAGCGGTTVSNTGANSAQPSSSPASGTATGSGSDAGFQPGDCVTDTRNGWAQRPCSQAQDLILAVLKPEASGNSAPPLCEKHSFCGRSVSDWWNSGMGQTSDSLDGAVTYCMVTGPAVASGSS
jgi:hypothetical protein